MSARILRPLREAVLNFHEDGCMNHAAAVAFYSLLSLAPLLYLVGASLRRVFDARGTTDAILERVASFFPPEAHEGLKAIELHPPDVGPIIWLVVPALLWVAASAFIEFEYSLSIVFGARRHGGPILPRLKAFALLGIGWLLLGGGIVFSTLLPRLGRFRTALGLPPAPDRITALLSWLSSAALTYVLFLLFYRMLTRITVRWPAAAAGAGLALVLWEIARRVFGWALSSSSAYGLLTGALAGMVAFLLWIYVSVAVILMGAELAAVLNGNRPDHERHA